MAAEVGGKPHDLLGRAWYRAAPSVGAILAPVSYTHLDVYKRQGDYTSTVGALVNEGEEVLLLGIAEVNSID